MITSRTLFLPDFTSVCFVFRLVFIPCRVNDDDEEAERENKNKTEEEEESKNFWLRRSEKKNIKIMIHLN
jgi:hypothetical protein